MNALRTEVGGSFPLTALIVAPVAVALGAALSVAMRAGAGGLMLGIALLMVGTLMIHVYLRVTAWALGLIGKILFDALMRGIPSAPADLADEAVPA